MKKIYISPELTILTVQVQHVMAGSPVGTAVTEEEADQNLDVLSRRNSTSMWDDEDDDLDF
jgi:hypothetical protein